MHTAVSISSRAASICSMLLSCRQHEAIQGALVGSSVYQFWPHLSTFALKNTSSLVPRPISSPLPAAALFHQGNFQVVDPLWSCCQTPGGVGQDVCVCANADYLTLVCIRWLTESAGGIPVMTPQPSHPGQSDSGDGSAEWFRDWAARLMKGSRPGGHRCELMKYTSPLLRGGLCLRAPSAVWDACMRCVLPLQKSQVSPSVYLSATGVWRALPSFLFLKQWLSPIAVIIAAFYPLSWAAKPPPKLSEVRWRCKFLPLIRIWLGSSGNSISTLWLNIDLDIKICRNYCISP